MHRVLNRWKPDQEKLIEKQIKRNWLKNRSREIGWKTIFDCQSKWRKKSLNKKERTPGHMYVLWGKHFTCNTVKKLNEGFLNNTLVLDFSRFCVIIRLFHSRHNGQWPPTLKDFYTRSYPLHYMIILILEKEPVFPFSILSAKQGNYWYHFYNVFGMTRSLTEDWTWDLLHSMPALYHKAIKEAVIKLA